jgi:glutathione reductase (NADPH)
MSGRDTRIPMKLVVDGSSDRVLGRHIVGDRAETSGGCVAVKMKTKADFDSTIALHPTAAEELARCTPDGKVCEASGGVAGFHAFGSS